MKAELTGNLVHLRPFRKVDLRRRADWTSDDELVSMMGADPTEEPFVSSEDEEQRNADWLDDRQKAGNDAGTDSKGECAWRDLSAAVSSGNDSTG
jgi:hypothetical protein